VKKICGIVGNVSAEVVSEKKDDILVEGRRLASWHKNVIVKVPMTPDGLAAGKILAGEGTRINVTLCFSVNQALLAAAIGAYIISPFVGRVDDINEDGMIIVRDIVAAYRQQDIKTKVLAASLRGPLHVSQAALAGADIGTMPFGVLQAMFKHPLTDAGLKRFKEDYLKSQEAKPAQPEALAKR
jgi:transaldolase